MTDYLQALAFGVFPSPDAADPRAVLELAEVAETSGLDLLTVQDHPYQAAHLDAWTLLSVVAARTTTLRVALDVANLPLRPPVVLAKAVATLDLLSGGRAELGLGAGAFWDAIVAAGGTRLTAGESVIALEQGIEVIRGVWRPDGTPPVRVDGHHHRVVGLHPGPQPAHPVEIWLGAYRPRMLRLTGRVADGWLPSMGYADPDVLAGMNAVIDDAARSAGRDPASVRRLYNVSGRFGGPVSSAHLAGMPRDWAEQLARLTLEHGMSTFILGSDDPADVRRFGEEVAPLVRDLVDSQRAERVERAERAERVVVSTDPDAHRATDQAVESAAESSDESAPPTRTEAEEAASATAYEPGPIVVVTTPDDGSRLSDQAAWDESTRPRFPVVEGATYTLQQQAAPQHLIDVHDALRAELTQLRDVVGQVAAGELEVGPARSAINRMTLRQNNWTLGAYCEQYCRVVTGHHTLEDRSVFPHLRRVAGAAPVIDRLTEEHEVIADLLEHVDRALVGLVADGEGPGGVAPLQEVIDLLTDALLSHLSYEERELFHPLAMTGFQ